MTVVRRWLPWAVLVVVAVAVLVLGAHRSSRPTLDGQVSHIASLVRCPVCVGETAAQSQSAPSVEIRAQIRQDLQAGMNQGQILNSLVSDYGSGILERPSTSGISLIVWVLPAVAGALGLGGLVLLLRRLARGAPALAVGIAGGPAALAVGPKVRLAERGRMGLAVLSRGGRRRLLLGVMGAALLAAGAGWVLVSATSDRVAGQPITGQALGAAAIQSDLRAAATDVSSGDAVAAVKEYQKILDSNPDQLDALTQEGWLLAQTQQPALLDQGLALLARAEKVDPSYSSAHVYRGIALLSEHDYSDSIPEFQWYLAHNPDPQLVSVVKAALAKAQAG